MELTPMQAERLKARMIAGGHRGRMIGAAMNKRIKAEKITLAREEAAQKIRLLGEENLFFLGIGLYWGEGTKSAASALAISNSDPRIIQITMRWFEECFKVEKDRFQPRIFIHAMHRSREAELLRFWSKTLGLPKSQFSRTIFIDRKNKKVYENHDTYYGVLALRVRKGTYLRYRILALIERLSEQGRYLPV